MYPYKGHERFKLALSASRILSLLVLSAAFMIFVYKSFAVKEVLHISMPGLPQPIGTEILLITSAGQSSDIYIIKDIVNNLMIHNFFMPQASTTDLEDINSVMVVVGSSKIGKQLNEINQAQEVYRISTLLEDLNTNGIPIITVYIGGYQRRNKETDELLKLCCTYSDYVIATEQGDQERYLSNMCIQLAKPLTLVKDIRDLSEPIASIFR